MTLKSTIIFLLFVAISIFCIILSAPIVAFLLLTSWNGRTTIFGNSKWGRANEHPSHATKGYWQEWHWLVIRNPVNNLLTHTLALDTGHPIIKSGSDTHYFATMDGGWEYYLKKPYGKRLFGIRLGWKIMNSDNPALVFVINPWQPA